MDYKKHLESTGHFEALGKVSANFSLLEHSLRALLWGFFGKDTVLTDVVASQLSFQRLLACVTGIANHKLEQGEQLDTLLNLLKEAGDLEAERNKIVHSIWAPREKGPGSEPYAIRWKPVSLRKGRLNPQVETVDSKELESLADKIYSCSHSILVEKSRITGENT